MENLSTSDVRKAIYNEQNGLCVISGNKLMDNFHLQHLAPLSTNLSNQKLFESAQPQFIGISSDVSTHLTPQLDELAVKLSLPGMREDGSVKLVGNCYLAEYESRLFRISELEDDIKIISQTIKGKYVLYDYKGSIRSNVQKALNYLKSKYLDELSIDGDSLYIDDSPFETNSVKKDTYILHAKSIWSTFNIDDKSVSSDSFENKSQIINQTEKFEFKAKNNVEPALGVDSISDVLADISSKLTKDSGMMIGVFGRWGRGKTFLAHQTISKLMKENSSWYNVNFSAWKYQNTESSWSHLHDKILKELEKDNSFKGKLKNLHNRIKANIIKKGTARLYLGITSVIFLLIWVFFVDKVALVQLLASMMTFGAFVLLVKSFMFVNASSGIIKKIGTSYFSKTSYRSNLGLQADIEESLVAMLSSWIPKNSQSKLVIFVDDIDRCDITNVLDVIDGLRLILDNPEIYSRVIIISAIDERILKNAIEIKYSLIDKRQRDEIYSEYLQKMFIIGLKLDQLCEQESAEFLEKILPVLKSTNSTQASNNNHTKVANTSSETTKSPINTAKINVHLPVNSLTDTTNTNEIQAKDIEVFEISSSEHEQLINSIVKLNIRTPRNIKIFYYKYLIAKKLLFISLEEKKLLAKWDESKQEAQLIEHLIAISNNVSVDNTYKNEHIEVESVIEKVSRLVSAI
ncbi:P-loop NTPase fold protein [Pseudoalteromonas sp. M58]|uniref:KAP family P-loop NTPase fold protein n=1 Tax=Pseudoalteromonas sp. M58 TaxID=3141534 RepID=UPI00366C2F2A